MNVEDIHALPDNLGGWLLCIEGIDVMFTNVRDIAGSGASAWIGTSFGARTVKLGLIVPSELKLGETDPWAASIVTSGDTTFGVLDLDETLVSLFVDFEPDETTDTLGGRISPLDDPAPDPAVGLDAETITVWGRHVGIERIGPAGERRYFWITPSDPPPGLDHFATSGWPSTHVTDAAAQWAGRKVAVYRIVRDPDTSTWPDWQAQYDGGSLWWYGTMLDTGQWRDVATADGSGRAFMFECGGPATWLERTANLSRPTTWYRPSAGVQLTGDELLVAAWIEPIEWEQLGDGIGIARTKYDAHTLQSGDDLTGCSTATELWSQIRDIVYTMVDGSNNGTVAAVDNASWTFSASNGLWNNGNAPRDVRYCRIAANGRTIEIKCEPDANLFGFRLGIAADARVWQAAGWDINDYHFTSNFLGECPVGGTNWGEAAGDELLPAGHVVGLFSTRDEQTQGPEQQSLWDNNGAWKGYVAPYPNGCVTLDHEGGTEVYLAVGVVLCEGQHGQPFTKASQIDAVDCDAAGWWIFRGQKLTAAEYLAGIREASEYVAVALCEWVSTSDGDGIEVNSNGQATIRIIRWEDPRAFGLPFDKLTEPWVNVTGNLECAPLGVLGGIDLPGWRHRMIVSALLSSGTATWDTTGDVVTITTGTMQPGDIPASETAGDIEVADMGLGLPPAFVDWASFYTAAAQLPGGPGGALNRILYPLYGSVKLSTLLRECMAGAGWAWTLQRQSAAFVPAFGCYDPLRLVQPGEVVATLTRADMVELEIGGEPQWRGTVSLRQGGPYDRFEYEVGGAPIDVEGDGGKPYVLVQESTDAGRRYRSGRITWSVKDAGLRDPAPWLGTPGQQVYDWTGHARNRFASGIGPRLAKQQRVYRATYNARFAGLLGLGSPVHVIDGTAETPDGQRGINHRGRVLECSIVARGPEKCAVRVAIELERKAVTDVHVWGPYAYAGVDSWDSGTSTLTISEDHALVGGTHKDTTGWTQPSWDSHAAGALLVTVYQSEDGVTIDTNLTATAEMSSVDTALLTLTLANITGTIYRDTVKIVVADEYDNQTAEWAQYILAQVCAPSGLYNGVDKGVRLK